MKVVGYIASSIAGLSDKSLEIKIQKGQIEKYCDAQRVSLIKVYVDKPVSSHKDRPALLELLNDSSQSKFDRVVVFKFDALGLDKELRTIAFNELMNNKVEIFSVSEKTVMINPLKSTQNQNVKVDNILKKVKDIPSLPEVVTKVMELVSNPNSSAAELSRVIAHDPGLTTRVLRLVNSAYYGFPKQISSVQQAIMILGFTTMRGLVLSTSIFKIFAQQDSKLGQTIDYRSFWKHSISTALCARVVASKVSSSETGEAFSCGILHDIGKVIFDQYGHADYVKVFSSLKKRYTTKDFLEAELNVFGLNHADIGYKVSEKWNLPLSLSETIKCHHNPINAVDHMRLVSVVYIANIFSNIIVNNRFSMSIIHFDPAVLEYLEISDDDLYELFNTCKAEVESGGGLDSFFE